MQVIKTYTEPTTLIFCGEFNPDGDDLIDLYDDYCDYLVKDDVSEVEAESLGRVNIFTIDEFKKFKEHWDNQEEDVYDSIFVVALNYVGNVYTYLKLPREEIIIEDFDYTKGSIYRHHPNKVLIAFLLEGDYNLEVLSIGEVNEKLK